MELDAKLAALEDMSSSELRAAWQRLACKVAPRIGGGPRWIRTFDMESIKIQTVPGRIATEKMAPNSVFPVRNGLSAVPKKTGNAQIRAKNG